MPVRSLKRQRASVTGYFPSLKFGRMMAFESSLERDLLHLLDFEASVTNFKEQPLTVTYEHGVKVRCYTPDFRVSDAGMEVLVKCKPRKKISRGDNQTKFAATYAFVPRGGSHFALSPRTLSGGTISKASSG